MATRVGNSYEVLQMEEDFLWADDPFAQLPNLVPRRGGRYKQHPSNLSYSEGIMIHESNCRVLTGVFDHTSMN